MKATTTILAGVAVFGGVLGALQVNRMIEHHQDMGGSILPLSVNATAQPAAYDPNAIQAAPFDFRAAAKAVNGSVVSVDRYERVRRGWYDDRGAIAETGQGSGVVVSENGIIVTNNHVVARDDGSVVDQVKVRTSDNRTLNAKVLGHDARSDLAVLKVDAKNLNPIAMGNSTDVQVGQWVLAVGNPLGFNNTVSVGVVSSLKRSLPVGGQGLVDAIQTDAAINPGNSGGALCDAQGRLIGINSAIASSTGQSVGIGFAIPVDRVKTIVDDIVKYGEARYAGLGISYNPQYDGVLSDPEARASFAQQVGVDNVPNSGIIVLQSTGAAQEAGIRQYDVLTSIDGQRVNASFDLNKVLVPKKPGDKVQVKWWSKGEMKSASIALQEIRPNRPI